MRKVGLLRVGFEVSGFMFTSRICALQLRISYPSALAVVRRLEEREAAATTKAAPLPDWSAALASAVFSDTPADDSLGVSGPAAEVATIGGADDDDTVGGEVDDDDDGEEEAVTQGKRAKRAVALQQQQRFLTQAEVEAQVGWIDSACCYQVLR